MVVELKSNITEREKAVLVGVECEGNQTQTLSLADSLTELALLAETAGVEVVGNLTQNRQHPDVATYVGKGKVEELRKLCEITEADVVIVDAELSPAQLRNLENMLENLKVLDRTSLILDIFAQRARSNEGVVQVELAQQRYRLPRIRGQGLVLSRLGGGIGTRGPGETKLEVDKRTIRMRIRQLERELKVIKAQRELVRKNRKENGILSVALVGYTNAGKSTLLNLLTAADVLVEDKLFATLDITTRKLILPQGRKVLLSDTVGFIQKLPHALVAAFKSTLEETLYADVLLHIVDSSHEHFAEQVAAVQSVLRELKADSIPLITVYNKTDLIDEVQKKKLCDNVDECAVISAVTGEGLDELKILLEDFFNRRLAPIKLLLPYNKGAMLEKLFEVAEVQEKEYLAEGVMLKVMLSEEWKGYVEDYIIEDANE